MVLSAKLTEKLILKTLTVSASTIGEPIEIFSTVKTFYASITTQRGNRSFDSTVQSETYTDSVAFYTYFFRLDNPKKQYRIEYNGELYEVMNFTPIQREAVVIDCRRIK